MKKYLRPLLVYSLLAALLYLALRNAPLTEIWRTLKSLQIWQIVILAFINAVIYILITLRWWIIVRAERKAVTYFPLLLTRLAVFGVSYFTLGPQVGGEPLQVLYLRRHYGMSYTRATATVIMDKLLELLANFVLFGLGLTAIFEAGVLSARASQLPVGLSALLVIPPLHIVLLRRGNYPLSAVMKKFTRNKFTRFISAAEHLAGRFCQRRLAGLVSATLVSVTAAACMVFEFFLMTTFLGVDLTFWQTIAAWTAGWLAFLIPLPGGLGALEASQVLTLGAFGISAAAAISVTLLMRARDLLIGGIGLLLAGRVK